MMCCDSWDPGTSPVGECPECGGDVDEEGQTTLPCCFYSPKVCDTCGWQPCDGSC